ncbi:MAG TPA: hypothetical protein VHU88_21645 [Sporichthyaceae bacterium]|nr:hypothetical protein [Sporichthyaceae bacterium]
MTVATLATAGLALAALTGSMQVLRMAVIASWLIALAIAGYAGHRGRKDSRELALAESTRRRDESLFAAQLETLSTGIKSLETQLQRLNTEAATLRSEVVQLRAEKAEADEIVRLALAERARAAVAEREANDQRLLTAAAFEAAAAVLESLSSGVISEDEPDWVSSWIANLGTRGELDLTMHDDTIALDLSACRDDTLVATA